MDTGRLEGQLMTSVIVSNRRAMTTDVCVSIDGGGKRFLTKVREDLFLCYFPIKWSVQQANSFVQVASSRKFVY